MRGRVGIDTNQKRSQATSKCHQNIATNACNSGRMMEEEENNGGKEVEDEFGANVPEGKVLLQEFS